MSRARMERRKRPAGHRRVLRLERRRRLEHRAAHWRVMARQVRMEPLRQPCDQDCRVGHVLARCPLCRGPFPVVAFVVTADEELSVSGPVAFRQLVASRIDSATRALWREIAPSSVRRRARSPWDYVPEVEYLRVWMGR